MVHSLQDVEIVLQICPYMKENIFLNLLQSKDVSMHHLKRLDIYLFIIVADFIKVSKYLMKWEN